MVVIVVVMVMCIGVQEKKQDNTKAFGLLLLADRSRRNCLRSRLWPPSHGGHVGPCPTLRKGGNAPCSGT